MMKRMEIISMPTHRDTSVSNVFSIADLHAAGMLIQISRIIAEQMKGPRPMHPQIPAALLSPPLQATYPWMRAQTVPRMAEARMRAQAVSILGKSSHGPPALEISVAFTVKPPSEYSWLDRAQM